MQSINTYINTYLPRPYLPTYLHTYIHTSLTHSINQSTKQPTNQSINQSTNQSTNQPINQYQQQCLLHPLGIVTTERFHSGVVTTDVILITCGTARSTVIAQWSQFLYLCEQPAGYKGQTKARLTCAPPGWTGRVPSFTPRAAGR